MNESLLVALMVLALLLSVAALVVALRASRVANRRSRRARKAPELPTDVQGLRGEVHALRAEVSDALRHLSYDAFGDMGGALSWSLALLDDGGNGVVLTSIHGRSEARTYAKGVSAWTCDQQLSPEEEEAIRFARTA